MRIYKNKYISVTSLVDLKDPFDDTAFKNWCERQGKDAQLIADTSKILGSKVSEAINNSYLGLEWLTAPLVDKLEGDLMKGVWDFLESYKVVASEEYVECSELNYAGRFDGIIEKDGVRILADWKTFGAHNDKPYKKDSKKLKHTKWQLSLYKYAMGWKGDIGVVVFKNDGTWELEMLKYDEEMVNWVRENQTEINRIINETYISS